jgi:thiol-disulfide isomerase/thioredoxin
VKSAAEGACAALRPNPLSATLRALVPEFDLPDLAGKKVSLSSLRGRPVLVSFFATWCPPCVEESPSLEELARRLGNKATVAIVSVDEDLDALKKYFAKGSPGHRGARREPQGSREFRNLEVSRVLPPRWIGQGSLRLHQQARLVAARSRGLVEGLVPEAAACIESLK